MRAYFVICFLYHVLRDQWQGAGRRDATVIIIPFRSSDLVAVYDGAYYKYEFVRIEEPTKLIYAGRLRSVHARLCPRRQSRVTPLRTFYKKKNNDNNNNNDQKDVENKSFFPRFLASSRSSNSPRACLLSTGLIKVPRFPLSVFRTPWTIAVVVGSIR